MYVRTYSRLLTNSSLALGSRRVRSFIIDFKSWKGSWIGNRYLVGRVDADGVLAPPPSAQWPVRTREGLMSCVHAATGAEDTWSAKTDDRSQLHHIAPHQWLSEPKKKLNTCCLFTIYTYGISVSTRGHAQCRKRERRMMVVCWMR